MAGRAFDATERLGIDAVASAVSKMGYIWREQPVADFGIDGHIELVGPDKKPTGQLIAVQVKSGPSYFSKEKQHVVPFYLQEDHWDYWSAHSLPVIVVLHDETTHRTVWEWVTPETVIKTGQMRRLDIPLRQALDDRHKYKLGLKGPIDSASARRQRFVMDIGIMKLLNEKEEMYISFNMWVNKSLTFRGAEIRFDDPHKVEADIELPWVSTHSDVNEIAWVLFPWLRLDEYYSCENHAGEVEEHVLYCSLNDAARAFLAVEDFFENVSEAPPLPARPRESDDWSVDRWRDDNDDLESSWSAVDSFGKAEHESRSRARSSSMASRLDAQDRRGRAD